MRLPALLVLATLALPATAEAKLPSAPKGWPKKLELGLTSQPNTASEIRSEAPFGFRYQYLAGDVRAESGWQNWNEDGQFVKFYVDESRDARITPVFSWYVLQHSAPGQGRAEDQAIKANLADDEFVKAWLDNLELALRRTGNRRTVIQIEPDFWGHIQYLYGDKAPAQVRRLAREMVKLRNRVAPKVLLGYHVSIWGTKTDIVLQNTPTPQVDKLAKRAAKFYKSLDVKFDLVFGEMDDRDAGFGEVVEGDGGRSRWDRADYARHVRFFSRFVKVAKRRIVMWQIPLGNSKLDNTYQRYRDNKVETLLGDPGRKWLRRYARAGVIAFLFGQGADATTTAKTDGGLFYELASDYYRAGRLKLP